jgi:hypothetical protein
MKPLRTHLLLVLLLSIAVAQSAEPCKQVVARNTKLADAVVLATGKDVGPSPGFWSGIVAAHQTVTYRLDTIFKGRLDTTEFTVEHTIVSGSDTVEKDSPSLNRQLFYKGSQLILFLHVRTLIPPEQTRIDVLPDHCSVMLAWPPNADLVRRALERTGIPKP